MERNFRSRLGAIPILILILLAIIAIMGAAATAWLFRQEIQSAVTWLLLLIVGLIALFNLRSLILWFKHIIDTIRGDGP